MTPHPPSWAQALIDLMVPRRTRDNVTGDLLEEYRETLVPERGKWAADRWYMRQAIAFLSRASLPAGLAVAAIMTGRTLLDIAIPLPLNQLATRAAVTTYLVMAIFAFGGFRIGRASGRIRLRDLPAEGALEELLSVVAAAAIMAVAATVIATVLAAAWVLTAIFVLAASSVLYPGITSGVIAPDALREGLDIPAHVIAFIGVILASIGASIGRMFIDRSGSRASARP